MPLDKKTTNNREQLLVFYSSALYCMTMFSFAIILHMSWYQTDYSATMQVRLL